MEIIMNISYANYFPSDFLLLSGDACPEKNGVRQPALLFFVCSTIELIHQSLIFFFTTHL